MKSLRKALKKAVKKMLSLSGYEISRSGTHLPQSLIDIPQPHISTSQPQVNFANFVNLSQAYEHRLNELYRDNLIAANEIRPRLLARLLGTAPSEAYYIVWALTKCNNINGDVCEFGVAQGETSALIANEIALSSKKTLHLFDSFEGLPKPSEKDKLKDDMFSLGNIEAYTGTMAFPEDMVRTRLEAISFPMERVIIHKGFIEQVIHSDRSLPREVSFAYVDFDFYQPIKLVLEFLHSATSNGAIIIVDDYDFFSTGAKTAVDEFVSEKNSKEMLYDFSVPDPRYGFFAILTRQG